MLSPRLDERNSLEPSTFFTSAEQICLADEFGDETGFWPEVDFSRSPSLLQLSRMHYDDAVAHDEGLFLIMGHVNEGDAEASAASGAVRSAFPRAVF